MAEGVTRTTKGQAMTKRPAGKKEERFPYWNRFDFNGNQTVKYKAYLRRKKARKKIRETK